MALVYSLAIAAILIPLILTPLVAVRAAPAIRANRFARRTRRAGVALSAEVGPIPAAFVALLAGSAAIIAVCWPLGEALSRLESTVDHRVFDHVHAQRDAGWEQLNNWITVIGDRGPLKVITVVAAVGFAILWRRRWWIPMAAMPLQFVLEQYTQEILKLVVNRGHPPTDLGTYPSGGCARVLMTFGTIAILAGLTWRIPRSGRTVLATALTVAVTTEGYTRIYLQKHWFTDVIGGWIFGSLLLGVMALSLFIATGRFNEANPSSVAHPDFAGPTPARSRALG